MIIYFYKNLIIYLIQVLKCLINGFFGQNKVRGLNFFFEIKDLVLAWRTPTPRLDNKGLMGSE